MNLSAPIVGLLAIVASLGAMSPAAVAAPSPTVTIASVQGAGSTSPVVGQTVTVVGVVTADLRGGDALGRVYVQSTESAHLAGASDAIAVVAAGGAVHRGAEIRVTGRVSESEGETRIDATDVAVLRDAVKVPAATELLAITDPESVEGMLVTSSSYLLTGLAATGQPIVAAPEGPGLTVGDGHATTSGTPYLPSDSVIRPGDAFSFAQTGLILSRSSSGYRLEPVVPVTASSPAAYLSGFHLTSNRLGAAPTLG